MSYKTPAILLSNELRGIDGMIQDLALHMDVSLYTGGISWLNYSHGLAERHVEYRDGKEYVYPASWQDSNKKDPVSLMPNDTGNFSFWVDNGVEYVKNGKREKHKLSCIFYVDLKQVAPTDNFKQSKTKIRQDVMEFFRVHENAGMGTWKITGYIDDDITKVYDGFSVGQLDNKLCQLPKYAIRIDFEYSFLVDCPVNNSYA